MAMDEAGSVTLWLGALKAGELDAAQPLWERYFARLVRLTRARRRAAPRAGAVADEEDAALSAFDSFCDGAAQGRFPLLADRDELWRPLVVLTARKVVSQARHERREKRGDGRDAGLAEIVGAEPTPEFAAMVAEELQRRINDLGDEDLRQNALWKMEGFTN